MKFDPMNPQPPVMSIFIRGPFVHGSRLKTVLNEIFWKWYYFEQQF